jgi:hypothetical protein
MTELTPTFLGVAGALLGVTVGSALTIAGQWMHRQHLQRERI